MPAVKVEDVARAVLEEQPDNFVEFMTQVFGIRVEDYPGLRSRLETMHVSLRHDVVLHLSQLLKDRQLDLVALTHSDVDDEMTADIKRDLLDRLVHDLPAPPSPLPLTPELREWAYGQYTEDEIVAGLQEAREQNGPELRDVVRRLEQELRERERTNH